MSQKGKEALRSFIQQHAKSAEELKAEAIAQEEIRNRYSQDVSKLETNIKTFNEKLDPLIDPSITDPDQAVLCWVRRPTQEEWENMIPEELRQYENPEDVPEDLQTKYKDHNFVMMSKLIKNPEHDAEWWKKNCGTLHFQMLFRQHLIDTYRKLGLLIANF